MNDPIILLTASMTSLAALSIVAFAGLRGWRGWLELQHMQLTARSGGDAPAPSSGARIELADLKERIRKLEAIAAGVDL